MGGLLKSNTLIYPEFAPCQGPGCLDVFLVNPNTPWGRCYCSERLSQSLLVTQQVKEEVGFEPSSTYFQSDVVLPWACGSTNSHLPTFTLFPKLFLLH